MSVARSALRQRAAVAAGVGLRRARRRRRAAIHARQRLDALRLVAVAARSFLWKRTVCRRSSAILELDLAVGVPEEPRVAQPRRDDALGVLRDDPLVLRLGVDDGEERRLQLAVVVDHREVVLMVDQRRRQHFLRQLAGTPRSKKPATTAGNSTRSATSSSSAACSRQAARGRRACAPWPRARARSDRGARRASRIDEVLGQPRLVVVEASAP